MRLTTIPTPAIVAEVQRRRDECDAVLTKWASLRDAIEQHPKATRRTPARKRAKAANYRAALPGWTFDALTLANRAGANSVNAARVWLAVNVGRYVKRIGRGKYRRLR